MDRRGCKFIVSDHAFTRAVQRHITAEDIKSALLDGKRIFDFRKKCCVFNYGEEVEESDNCKHHAPEEPA